MSEENKEDWLSIGELGHIWEAAPWAADKAVRELVKQGVMEEKMETREYSTGPKDVEVFRVKE